MSIPHEHGGSAFPSTGYADGMSLRDYFAGQALNGLLVWGKHWFPSNVAIDPKSPTAPIVGNIVDVAYRYADAMLAERAKGAPS